MDLMRTSWVEGLFDLQNPYLGGTMRIAVLSDPNNFHTQKWVKALQKAGAEVVVMSFDPSNATEFEAIQLKPPVGRGKGYSYLDYLRGGNVLAMALKEHRIDVLNPLNVTPFGVWAMQSAFHPVVACAFGADILEYPPDYHRSNAAQGRSWDALTHKSTRIERWKSRLKYRFYRKKVAQALQNADWVTGDNQYLVDCMAEWFAVPRAKMEVLRWGVEPELFEVNEAELQKTRALFSIQPLQKVVLSPRGLKPIYQADIILESFARLLEQGHQDTVFIMLGAGYAVSPEVSIRAEKLAKSYPNFRYVKTALPRETMHALWRLTDVFVSAPVYDGYSAALAEGRYVGAIPVVNDIPAHRELILHGQNGWICHPFTADKLHHDLEHLLQHTAEFHSTFAQTNREWILQHSLMETNARRFLEIVSLRCL
ncbi:MAG: glycosyltransferase family 4 protein [Bacteroidetes bacterium]|nr:glycosyltransferase family 4 protein [Bacteroidota bacterium]